MDSTLDLLTLGFVRDSRAPSLLLSRGPLAATLALPTIRGSSRSLVSRSATAARRDADVGSGARQLGIQDPRAGRSRYPQWLRRTHTPPLTLWSGDAGSRGASRRLRSWARARRARFGLGSPDASPGARGGGPWSQVWRAGIDAAAHRGALAASGRTVAVLGSGLDRLYPLENGYLADRIGETGALVSEFPLGTRPWKSNFPRRNRVIAGWVRAVVVVEAGERSGALSTARAAVDEGRDVMAVPGAFEPQAEGTNALLRDGAALVRSSADVLAELGIRAPREREAMPEDAVLRAMTRGVPVCVDEIQVRSGLALPVVLARLSALELEGAIARLAGGLFARDAPQHGYTRS